MFGKLLLSLVIKYIENHPDQIVELLAEAGKAGVNALKAHNASKAVAIQPAA